MTAHVHIAICGAGPVGQALALMLHQQGIPAHDIVLLDAKTSAQACHDARSIALSYGSKQILDALHVWPVKATAIRQIHVSRRGHFGRSLISASDYQLPALGYVARYGDIIAPLEARLQECGITVQRPVLVNAVDEQTDRVTVTLSELGNLGTSNTLSADLVIQAEGGTFSDQDQRTQHHDYQQTAVIAHITTSAPVAQRAFERFTAEGPLALLPQDDGYALVWCARPDHAASLLTLNDANFKQALQQAFGNRLGTILTASARHAYPLGLNAQTYATARTVRIGNAAQTLHPVAGQGLNLGLRDARVLAGCLGTCPPDSALASFIKKRQIDRQMTIRLTDGMARIFAGTPDGTLTQAVLGLGLGVVDMLAPAKKMLAQQMMFGWR
ncbi:UbiH/UbiF/VisC/COQ6 family ubiquinone biosynthesis hydroxylase [soil metagenome]